jgi:Tfp pilus assembly protein PilF
MFVRLWIIWFLLLMLISFGVCGCASDGKGKGMNYETIKANPKRDPGAAAKLNKQGIESMSKGKIEKAEKLFKDALVKDINYGPAHNNLGRLYFDQDKNYLAAWEFEYATKVMPGRSEPYNNLGMVMERVGKMERAIEAYEIANEMNPNHPEITGNLARSWWCHDKTHPKTRELLEQLIFIDCRPEWVTWAKEQIAYGKLAAGDRPPNSTPSGFSSEPLPDMRPTPAQPFPYPVPSLAPPLSALSQ